MKKFLESSQYIDCQHAEITGKAASLAVGAEDNISIIKSCFEFVRDEIKHSWDFKMNPVTCKASDVLKHGTGHCYAKSHLLAALLRANGIPTGLCYQRLTISDGVPPFSLHGLNAVYIEEYGWHRLDARGNNSSLRTNFCPPTESLAFPITSIGEADLPEIWSEPLPNVVSILESCKSYLEVSDNLPDILLIPANKPIKHDAASGAS